MTSYALTTDAWHVDADEFPAGAPLPEQARFLLRYAILAPSSHNSQPWRFDVGTNRITVTADDSRWLRVADADRRELHLSIGCAVENLVVAAQHFGMSPSVERSATPDDARTDVRLQAENDVDFRRPDELFDALTERRTSHEEFDARGPDGEVVRRLTEQAVESGADLELLSSDALKRDLAELQLEADRGLMDDRAYRRELGDWIGSGALGDGWLKARISQFVVDHFDLGESEGAKNEERLRRAPFVGVVTTPDDSPARRILAGQLYERIALAATMEELATHPLSQTLEYDDYRQRVASLLGTSDPPQHLFRLGSPTESGPHTPRWPVEKFLNPA